MPGSWNPQDFPYLNDETCTETSGRTRQYNCLAWAVGETTRRWEPDPYYIYYWPPSAPREMTIPAFVAAYGTVGFAPCPDGTLENGVEKIALFASLWRSFNRELIEIPTHAALQLPTGRWTSKIGDFEDIDHMTVDAVRGPLYGSVSRFLSRLRQ